MKSLLVCSSHSKKRKKVKHAKSLMKEIETLSSGTTVQKPFFCLVVTFYIQKLLAPVSTRKRSIPGTHSPTPLPHPQVHASTQLLGTSHLIPRRPPFHPIHSHRDICERIYYTKQGASKIQCRNNSVFQGLGQDLLKPHPNTGQAVGLGAQALSL